MVIRNQNSGEYLKISQQASLLLSNKPREATRFPLKYISSKSKAKLSFLIIIS